MSEVLISVENLTKKFAKNFKLSSKQGLIKVFNGLCRIDNSSQEILKDEFLALDDVSFTVKRGETLGLIGNNGAGKSTLLKHIGGIYAPDSGLVRVKGHVEGLIELGAGLHPLLSGRENIKQRVSVLSLSKVEENRIVDEIIDFSELSEFIDMPIRNYSSGMQARLGFASAILSKPDVLLIDEVLSVGDFSFRQKCLSKINEIKNDAAIIFVSHSDQSMRLFCNKGLVLSRGKVEFEGKIDDALGYYFDKYSTERISQFKSGFSEEFFNNNKIESVAGKWLSSLDEDREIFDVKEEISLSVNIKFNKSVKCNNLILGIPFYREGIYLGALSNEYINYKIEKVNDELNIRFKIDNLFNKGLIDSFITLYDGPECLVRKSLPRIKIFNHNSRQHGEFLINFKLVQVN
jgi:ABC-type polysaccharide/polyol phosphate transport system ATPase subunit